jgi:hypothetical protein
MLAHTIGPLSPRQILIAILRASQPLSEHRQTLCVDMMHGPVRVIWLRFKLRVRAHPEPNEKSLVAITLQALPSAAFRRWAPGEGVIWTYAALPCRLRSAPPWNCLHRKRTEVSLAIQDGCDYLRQAKYYRFREALIAGNATLEHARAEGEHMLVLVGMILVF